MTRVRDHLTARVSRARLELELRRSLRPAAVLVVGMALALAGVAYIFAQIGSSLTASTYEARFAVDDGTGVVAGRNDVRIAGVRVGTISEVERIDGRAVLTAQIESKYGRVFRDARAALRPNTALQDMLLDIVDRGTPAAGVLEGRRPLQQNQTTTSVDMGEVLQVFDGDTRARLYSLLRDFGGGLEARGDELRAAFVEVVPFLQALDRLSAELSERATKTRRVVRFTSAFMRELARRDRELRALAADGGAVFQELASSTPALDATLRGLPPTLTTVDASLADLRAVLPDLDRALDALGPVARRLPRGLAALRRLSATATPAVRSLRKPVRRLVPFADALPPLSANLRRAVTALRPQTGAFDHATATTAACSYEITRFLQWAPSALKLGDARGPILRTAFSLGRDNVEGQPDPTMYRPQDCAPGSSQEVVP